MTQFIPCRICATKPGPAPGFYFKKVKDRPQLGVVECECHKQFILQRHLESKVMEAGVWAEAINYDPDKNYLGTKSIKEVEHLKKYVYGFPKHKDLMVYMWGTNGTQKTYLAHWVGASILHQGYSVRYLLMQSLLMTLVGFDKDDGRQQEKNAEIEKLKNVDLLIVDVSFSRDKVTIYDSGYQLPYLDRFLRERCEMNKKGVVFISNKPPEDISKQKFSPSIESFVLRNIRRPDQGSTCLFFEDKYLELRNNQDVGDIGSFFDKE